MIPDWLAGRTYLVTVGSLGEVAFTLQSAVFRLVACDVRSRARRKCVEPTIGLKQAEMRRLACRRIPTAKKGKPSRGCVHARQDWTMYSIGIRPRQPHSARIRYYQSSGWLAIGCMVAGTASGPLNVGQVVCSTGAEVIIFGIGLFRHVRTCRSTYHLGGFGSETNHPHLGSHLDREPKKINR